MDERTLEEKIAQLDPDSARTVRALLGGPPTASLSPSEARALRAAARIAAPRPLEEVEEVLDLDLDLDGRSIRALAYRPASAVAPMPAMVCYHGGGFVLGTVEDYEPVCRQLANRLGALVVSVDYRLAPEHRFPAPLDDAYDAWCWVVDHASSLGVDAARVGVGGDSAGGNLAAAVSLRAVELGRVPPVVQLLVYPLVEWGLALEDYDPELAVPPLTAESMVYFLEHTFEDPATARTAAASPLAADSLVGQPPAVIVTAQFDVLRPSIERYADRLVAAGVPVTMLAYPGVVHGFFSQAPLIATATRAVDEASAALAPHLSATRG